MRISRRDLKVLIERYLFEQEEEVEGEVVAKMSCEFEDEE